MKKRRKVYDHLVSLKENILEKQEWLHDVREECFKETKKMAEKIKALEKHLQITYQINQKMESMWIKFEVLYAWKNMEKIVQSGHLGIKAYGIILHTLVTNECQEVACKFEEKVKQSLAGMMNVYDELVQDTKKYIKWPQINFQDEHLIPFHLF